MLCITQCDPHILCITAGTLRYAHIPPSAHLHHARRRQHAEAIHDASTVVGAHALWRRARRSLQPTHRRRSICGAVRTPRYVVQVNSRARRRCAAPRRARIVLLKGRPEVSRTRRLGHRSGGPRLEAQLGRRRWSKRRRARRRIRHLGAATVASKRMQAWNYAHARNTPASPSLEHGQPCIRALVTQKTWPQFHLRCQRRSGRHRRRAPSQRRRHHRRHPQTTPRTRPLLLQRQPRTDRVQRSQ